MKSKRRERGRRLVQTATFVAVLVVLALVLAVSFVVQGGRRAEEQEAATVLAEAGRTATAAVGQTGTAQAAATAVAAVSLHWSIFPAHREVRWVGQPPPTHPTDIAVSPDGRLLAIGTSVDLRLYETQSWEEVQRLSPFFGVRSLAFSRDGALLAVDAGSAVFLWAVDAGYGLGELRTDSARGIGPSSGVAFSPKEPLLATAFCALRDKSGHCLASRISLWDIATAVDMRAGTYPTWSELQVLASRSGEVRDIVFSPDGLTLVVNSGLVWVWEVEPWGEPRMLPWHSTVYSVAFSPDGTLLASGAVDGNVYLQTLEGQEVRALSTGETGVSHVTFSPDGQHLATVSAHSVALWEVASGHEVWRIRPYPGSASKAVFYPGGTLLATLGRDDPVVQVWAVPGGELVAVIRVEQGELPGPE